MKTLYSVITTQRHKTQVFEEVHFKLSRLWTAHCLILFNVSELVLAQFTEGKFIARVLVLPEVLNIQLNIFGL